LEELLPKDNERIPLPDFRLVEPSEVQAFSFEEMVRCEECLRANPPTRVNCLYCDAVLPTTEKNARLQRPGLRRLEKWEHGFNTILIPASPSLSDQMLCEASDLLKLSPDELQRIISTRRPLPLARAAGEDEAALIFRRLREVGLDTITVPDGQLRPDERQMVRIRSASIQGDLLIGYHLAGAEGVDLNLSQIVLLVLGRLLIRRVEVRERKSRRTEAELIHASEFFIDEAVLDIYAGLESPSLRVESSSFDFSVLGARKGLVAGENLLTLANMISELTSGVAIDDSYTQTRQAIEPIWPPEQRTEANGWHRQRPGKYSTSGVTETSNEDQFTRYSRLQYYLQMNPLVQSS
jgi:hypothetical protein